MRHCPTSLKIATVAVMTTAIMLVAGPIWAAVPDVTVFNIEVGQMYSIDVAPNEVGDTAFVLFGLDSGNPIGIIDGNSRTLLESFNPFPGEYLYTTGGIVVGRQLFLSTALSVLAVDIDTRAGIHVFQPPIPDGSYAGCGFVASPARDHIYTVAANHLVSIMPAHMPAQMSVVSTPVSVGNYAVGISPDGQQVYLLDSSTGLLARYAATDLRLLGSANITGPTGILNYRPSVVVAPDGLVYAGYVDWNFRFNISVSDADGGPVRSLFYSFFSEGLALTKDARYLVTGSGDFIERATLKAVVHVPTRIGSYAVHLTQDGRRTYISSYNSTEIPVLEIAPVTPVLIDIKPGSLTNPIPIRRSRLIPVALLSTPDFDATTVDPATICFGSAETDSERSCVEAHDTGHTEDVDGDGDLDLVLHYFTAQTGIALGDTQACLSGRTYDGISIEGCDTIQVF